MARASTTKAPPPPAGGAQAAAAEAPPPARRSPLPPELCSLARTVETIGERWTLLILRSAIYGLRRFEDFHHELGAPRTILSRRLAALVEAGLLERREYQEPGQRARFEYWLTEQGEALRVPFIALTQWGSRWLNTGRPPMVVMRNRHTRKRVRVGLVDEDAPVLTPADLTLELTPAGKAAAQAVYDRQAQEQARAAKRTARKR